MVNARSAVRESASVTRTVKVAGPAADGAPAMLPLGLRLTPAGNAPLAIDHTYGPRPPVAWSACAYSTPTLAFGSEALLIAGGVAAALIVKRSWRVAVRPAESVT